MLSNSIETASTVEPAAWSIEPPLAALFLVRFDTRVGYSIVWQRKVEGVNLEGIVEFKSFPSGLHNVEKDLVYFVHGSCAGLSAFRRGEASVEERNASFDAVGCLVPLSYGRLGRCWLHAEALEELTLSASHGKEGIERSLDTYWQQHNAAQTSQDLESAQTSQASPAQSHSKKHSRERRRGLSESMYLTTAVPGNHLAPLHPARALLDFLDTMGPLIFPLYRAALLRKRTLFVGKPPMKGPCEYVYSQSVLASIPQSTCDTLQDSALSRIRPLFSVGLHDIPELESFNTSQDVSGDVLVEHESSIIQRSRGWIACTSDEILSTKVQFYDLRVDLQQKVNGKIKTWPVVVTAQGQTIKATQRDFRRFKTLQHHLMALGEENYSDEAYHDDNEEEQEGERENDAVPHSKQKDRPSRERYNIWPWPSEDDIVEHAPWAAIAYDAYVWWASAGESVAELEEEDEEDRRSLAAMSELVDNFESSQNDSQSHLSNGAIEMALIAYFHHMTTTMFKVLSELIRNAGLQDVDCRVPGEYLSVDKEDLARMGLDVWSQADREFVRELVHLYFGLHAEVRGASIECCGMKIY